MYNAYKLYPHLFCEKYLNLRQRFPRRGTYFVHILAINVKRNLMLIYSFVILKIIKCESLK